MPFFSLVSAGKDKLHITGRTRDKLLGKNDIVFGVLSVGFPLQLILCPSWNVLPAFPALTKRQKDSIPYVPSPPNASNDWSQVPFSG